MSFIRLSVRSKVLLPQPDGPMNAVTRFVRICMVMSSQRAFDAVVERQPVDVDLDRAALAAVAGPRRRLRHRHGDAVICIWADADITDSGHLECA